MARRTRTVNRHTRFATALQKAMLESDINAARLAAKADEVASKLPDPVRIYPSTISKLLNGHTLTASREQLEAILPALSKDHGVHTDLIIAHLQDHCYGPNADMVEIRAKLSRPASRPQAKSDIERALETLKEVAATNSAAADTLVALAQFCRPT